MKSRMLTVTLGVMAVLTVMTLRPAAAVEGMFPMSGLGRLDLQAAGLEVSAEAIFNPDASSLVDGIVKLGGCTGFFVSGQGLILTNHHCAFRAIQDASTTDHDYLRDGFTAADGQEEFPAVGYTVRITESYRDVSPQVLEAVTPDMDPLKRTRALDQKMKQLSLDYEAAHPGKRAEVSEMFPGRSYVLFVYTYLKDVRLVYAPPQAIGNFGGEEDNWVWPRHAGDFSFVRAYVGPDGKPAAYSPDNVPYRPRTILAVSGRGVSAGDLVFLCGYPGRTYRHRSSSYLAFLNDITLPMTVQWYTWLIDRMEEAGDQDPARKLALASRMKSLNNTAKNYRGKLQGMARLDLIAAKQERERGLQAFIDSDPARQERYGHLLGDLDTYYQDLRSTADFGLWMRFLRRSPQVLQTALTVWECGQERLKPEAERESAYMARNLDRTLSRLQVMAKYFDPGMDRMILAELLRRAGEVPQAEKLRPFAGCLGTAGEARASKLLDRLFGRTRLMDPGFLAQAVTMTPDELHRQKEPFLELAADLYETYADLRTQQKRRKGVLDPLLAALENVSRVHDEGAFIPDANGTLRFTYGHIEGYSPRDAVAYRPLTTVQGLLEKATGTAPYALPPGMRELVAAKDFGPFMAPQLGGVPVDMLYSTDTTGGNSGSPVFDASGQVVGINFDRAWEATINDFAWDQAYSRSIGVDIRYVLWVIWKFGHGDRLIREMGIRLPEAP